MASVLFFSRHRGHREKPLSSTFHFAQTRERLKAPSPGGAEEFQSARVLSPLPGLIVAGPDSHGSRRGLNSFGPPGLSFHPISHCGSGRGATCNHQIRTSSSHPGGAAKKSILSTWAGGVKPPLLPFSTIFQVAARTAASSAGDSLSRSSATSFCTSPKVSNGRQARFRSRQ